MRDNLVNVVKNLKVSGNVQDVVVLSEKQREDKGMCIKKKLFDIQIACLIITSFPREFLIFPLGNRTPENAQWFVNTSFWNNSFS